jgi:hypothetical protein
MLKSVLTENGLMNPSIFPAILLTVPVGVNGIVTLQSVLEHADAVNETPVSCI